MALKYKDDEVCDACGGEGFVENCTNGGNCPCDGSADCLPLHDQCSTCNGNGTVKEEEGFRHG